MTAPDCLLAAAGLAAVSLLAGCASSPKQDGAAAAPIVQQAAEGPPSMVEGQATQDDRTAIRNTDSQIYGTEHAIDPDSAAVSGAQNQGIP